MRVDLKPLAANSAGYSFGAGFFHRRHLRIQIRIHRHLPQHGGGAFGGDFEAGGPEDAVDARGAAGPRYRLAVEFARG